LNQTSEERLPAKKIGKKTGGQQKSRTRVQQRKKRKHDQLGQDPVVRFKERKPRGSGREQKNKTIQKIK